MPRGYTEDPYLDSPERRRRMRIDDDMPNVRRTRRVRHVAAIPPPPPVPPPPPPRRVRRPRPPGNRSRARDYDYDDRYPRRDDYYEEDFSYPPPRSRSAPRPRYSRAPPPAYYPEDDYYDRPRRRERDHDDDYPKRENKPKVESKPQAKSSDGGGGRLAFGIIVLILFLLIGYMFRGPILDFINNPPPLQYQEYPDGVDFTVEKVMSLQASGPPTAAISYTLKSACPKDYIMGDFYLQDVQQVNVNPMPDSGYPDITTRSQEIMLWEEDNFLGSENFEATYTIRTRFYQWELDEESSGVIADIPTGLKQQYNHDEWRIDEDRDGNLDYEDDKDNDGLWDYKIEPSNQRIQKIANDKAGGSANVYIIVKNIYDYLTSDEILNYVTTSEGLPKDCITTLNQKRGDCDDYSILFVSLCRALDIPAWLELGVLYDRQHETWGGHGWAKVAIPFEGGWTAATIDIVNKQFLFHDPYRFIEWIDTGGDITVSEDGDTKTYNNLDYYYHSFSYRSSGSATINSPDTNDFRTINLNEFGDKHKVAVEGDPTNELCGTPGFEGFYLIIATLVIVTVVYLRKNKRA